MRDTLSQLVRLGIIILVAARLLGWADSVFFAPKRYTCVQEELDNDPGKKAAGYICYDKLRRDWGDRIVWVDARKLSDYEVNHLEFPDNRMFPIRPEADECQALIDAAMDRLFKASGNDECVVVFCTEGCTRAEEVAQKLREVVDAPVFVLAGGWDALLAAGMVHR